MTHSPLIAASVPREAWWITTASASGAYIEQVPDFVDKIEELLCLKIIKILGEDKCHILLVEAILRHIKLKGLHPQKLIEKGAGGVWKTFQKQLKSSSLYHGEIVLLDCDRTEKEIPKIEKFRARFKWEIHLTVLEPNCEGVILNWAGINSNSSKREFRRILANYEFIHPDQFIPFVIEELVSWDNPPNVVQELIGLLKRIALLG